MVGLNRGAALLAAVSVSALLLAACTSDPINASLRPNAEDVAAAPEKAPVGSYGALLRLGEATRQAGDPASAVGFFKRAHAMDLFKSEPLVRLGNALNDLGEYNQAAETFRDALNVDHNNAEALRGLGGALIALNQPAMAIDQYSAALGIEPDYRSYNGLGVANDHMGKHKAAQEYYQTGLKIYPNNLTLLNNLGLSQILSRDFDGAIATLASAAQQPGATARQRQNLALAYGLAGRDADAERVAHMDLDDRSVKANIAYYGILRVADDSALLAAVMGVHVPVNPAVAPASGVPAPSVSGPASGDGKPSSDAAPQSGPSTSDATTPENPQIAPASGPTSDVPAAKPQAKVEILPLPTEKPQTPGAQKTSDADAASSKSAKSLNSKEAVVVRPEPKPVQSATAATTAEPPKQQAAANTVQQSAAGSIAGDMAEQSAPPTNKAAAQTDQAASGTFMLQPIEESTSSAETAPLVQQAALPAPASESVRRDTYSSGPPVWYSAAEPAPQTSAGTITTSFKAIFVSVVDFFFGTNDKPAAREAPP